MRPDFNRQEPLIGDREASVEKGELYDARSLHSRAPDEHPGGKRYKTQRMSIQGVVGETPRV